MTTIKHGKFTFKETMLILPVCEIWEFRTLYAGLQYRLLAFWDKTGKKETLVLATHGFVKKTGKVDKKEIDKAEKIRLKYFKNKG